MTAMSGDSLAGVTCVVVLAISYILALWLHNAFLIAHRQYCITTFILFSELQAIAKDK